MHDERQLRFAVLADNKRASTTRLMAIWMNLLRVQRRKQRNIGRVVDRGAEHEFRIAVHVFRLRHETRVVNVD